MVKGGVMCTIQHISVVCNSLHIFSRSLKNRCQIKVPSYSLLQVCSDSEQLKEEKWCSLHCTTGTLPLVFLTGFVDTREIIIDRAVGEEGRQSFLVQCQKILIGFLSAGVTSPAGKKKSKRGTFIEVQMKQSSDCSRVASPD